MLALRETTFWTDVSCGWEREGAAVVNCVAFELILLLGL